MKTIKLTRDKITLVDNDDYKELSKVKWFAAKNKKNFYAKRGINLGKNKIKHLSMHQVIMSKPPEDHLQIDHIDGNTLNNQRNNLRFCTQSENMRNRRKQSNNTSGYVGVTYHKQVKKWRAETHLNGKHISLGLYEDIIEAAKAYNKFAIENHKEFAVLNEIPKKS